MPDARNHRGQHPQDAGLFAPEAIPSLGLATAELSWLLTRNYAPASALKLVGDRHSLTVRQRLAVARAACTDDQRARRAETRRTISDVHGRQILIDGFNLLITVEAAMSGGVLLRCRDGCLRDLSSVHGSYRTVEETAAAIEWVGSELAPAKPSEVRWLLDQPVSNSGRLASRIRETAASRKWNWSVELAMNPDREIIREASQQQVACVTSDSIILDQVSAWVDLTHDLPSTWPQALIIDLRDE